MGTEGKEKRKEKNKGILAKWVCRGPKKNNKVFREIKHSEYVSA